MAWTKNKKEEVPQLLSVCCKVGFIKYMDEFHGKKENGDYQLIRKMLQKCNACKNDCDVQIEMPKKK